MCQAKQKNNSKLGDNDDEIQRKSINRQNGIDRRKHVQSLPRSRASFEERLVLPKWRRSKQITASVHNPLAGATKPPAFSKPNHCGMLLLNADDDWLRDRVSMINWAPYWNAKGFHPMRRWRYESGGRCEAHCPGSVLPGQTSTSPTFWNPSLMRCLFILRSPDIELKFFRFPIFSPTLGNTCNADIFK